MLITIFYQIITIMDVNWPNLLTTFGISTAVTVSALGFFGKSLINRWIDRGKLKYQTKLNEEFESYRTELMRTTNELQERLRIEYSSLYNERLTAIKEIYEYLFRIERELQDFSFDSDFVSNQEDLDYVTGFMSKITGIINKLDNKIGVTLIYFSEDDAKALLEIMSQLNKLNIDWDEWRNQEDAIYNIAPLIKSIKTCKTGPIRALLQTIRSNFRKLVGVK